MAAQEDVTATGHSHVSQDMKESWQEGVATYLHDNVDASKHKYKPNKFFKNHDD